MWSGERLTKIQATARPRSCLARSGDKRVKPLRIEKKQELAEEQRKIENARHLHRQTHWNFGKSCADLA